MSRFAIKPSRVSAIKLKCIELKYLDTGEIVTYVSTNRINKHRPYSIIKETYVKRK